VALILAWCLVFLKSAVAMFKMIFPGEFSRVLQAHIDFLLMSALLFGLYAAKVPLPWPTRWTMVVGAFTNSSLFLMQAMFPELDAPVTVEGLLVSVFRLYLMSSIVITSYGFGSAALIVFLASFKTSSD
jgi:hypothetical protein